MTSRKRRIAGAIIAAFIGLSGIGAVTAAAATAHATASAPQFVYNG